MELQNYNLINKLFPSGKTFYYIKNGKIKEEIIHSDMSPQGAYILSFVYVFYNTWEEANEVLKVYTSKFNVN